MRLTTADGACPGAVWLPILSLRREDADRLRYNSADGRSGFLAKDGLDQIRSILAREFPVGDLVRCVSRLLHHMGRIFREETRLPAAGVRFTDKKLRQRIRKKKMAMGHRADDHENQQMM